MAYDDTTLATFMTVELGSSGVALSLTDASPGIVGAVAWVAGILGEPIAEQTDDLKTMTVASWRAWLAAFDAVTSQYDIKSDGDELKRSQFWEHIKYRLSLAETAASRYDEVADVLAGGGGTAYTTSVNTAGSPYGWPCGSEFS